MPYCRECGAQIEADASYCPSCRATRPHTILEPVIDQPTVSEPDPSKPESAIQPRQVEDTTVVAASTVKLTDGSRTVAVGEPVHDVVVRPNANVAGVLMGIISTFVLELGITIEWLTRYFVPVNEYDLFMLFLFIIFGSLLLGPKWSSLDATGKISAIALAFGTGAVFWWFWLQMFALTGLLRLFVVTGSSDSALARLVYVMAYRGCQVSVASTIGGYLASLIRRH